MLYDLNFLNPGSIFPPRDEIERLQTYKDNLYLFNCDTYNVFRHYYKDADVRILRVLNDYSDMIAYPVDINYHRLTSIKTADFVAGEPPTITAQGKDLEQILQNTDLNNKLYQSIIDISRYGDAVFRLYKKEGEDFGRISLYDPRSVFKVVNREDCSDVICYVLALPEELPESTQDKPMWQLNVQVHYPGYYIQNYYELEVIKAPDLYRMPNNRLISDLQLYKIKKIKESKKPIYTGLSDFALVTMHQLVTSDNCWGHDDYSILDPILSEIWVRLGQISIILDKHSRPDMYAPSHCFSQDVSGQWGVPYGSGNSYPLHPGDTAPGYLTWDGQLTAAFAELDRLFDQLYQVSELGAVYKAASNSTNIAYETMRSTFISALSKAKRITNCITDPLKKLISLVSELGGVDRVNKNDITIKWYDGLPNDERQEIEKSAMKINTGISTPTNELRDRFNMTQEEAEKLADESRQYNADKQNSHFGGFPDVGEYGDM